MENGNTSGDSRIGPCRRVKRSLKNFIGAALAMPFRPTSAQSLMACSRLAKEEA